MHDSHIGGLDKEFVNGVRLSSNNVEESSAAGQLVQRAAMLTSICLRAGEVAGG